MKTITKLSYSAFAVMVLALDNTQVAAQSWTPTGNMVGGGRAVHTATLLASGKVLVAGGRTSGGVVLNSAQLYDPATGTWTATGSMGTLREFHTATLLPSGKVLVAGGFTGSSTLSSSQLYDPATGTWTATASMSTARGLHTATLLPSGKVLVAGGFNGSAALSSAELYDPVTGTWTPTGSFGTARGNHTATLLPSGKVLVAGGDNGASVFTNAQLYDPATGTWTATGSMGTARTQPTATLLPSGKVLVAGGRRGVPDFFAGFLSSAELYDPVTATWTATASMSTARQEHTATLLVSGNVLVAGGISNFTGSFLSSAELYDPAIGTWTATCTSMGSARDAHTATLLTTGNVLVAGGNSVKAFNFRAFWRKYPDERMSRSSWVNDVARSARGESNFSRRRLRIAGSTLDQEVFWVRIAPTTISKRD